MSTLDPDSKQGVNLNPLRGTLVKDDHHDHRTPRPRDAQLTSATQAPFGHGTETKVDTSVRHTWEIEPARVSFGNAAWQTWMEETVVTTALDVPFSTTPPKCELYKLLLYEQDSHFLPHQDTVKAQNMFATIIIVLPSPYTGGQVHVSHSSSQQVFSFDSHILLSTYGVQCAQKIKSPPVTNFPPRTH
ncbi:hypothetical protein F5051DRAFT_33005 [Lentinula edodes]|nr:hypothetical protein F5051DRAFT_33005 [Lentinula edodes]